MCLWSGTRFRRDDQIYTHVLNRGGLGVKSPFWQRVDERNRRRGETFSLEVTREMFDFVENMWEPPGDEELAAHDGVVARTG